MHSEAGIAHFALGARSVLSIADLSSAVVAGRETHHSSILQSTEGVQMVGMVQVKNHMPSLWEQFFD